MAAKKKATRRASSARRPRRTAEDARNSILDAAEKRLAELGPGGIRLQQIARDVGVSHPGILHHFGSREGLLHAVVRRAIQSLEADIILAISESSLAAEPPALQVIEQTYRVLVEKGHARVLSWLMLAGLGFEAGTGVRAVAEVAHLRRTQVEPDAPFEDTVFRVLLAALVMMGEAVAGPSLRASAGLAGDPEAPRRFLAWLSSVVTAKEFAPRR